MQVRSVPQVKVHGNLLTNERRSVLESLKGFVYFNLAAANQDENLGVAHIGSEYNLCDRDEGYPRVIKFKSDDLGDNLAQSLCKTFRTPHNLL